MSSSALLNKSLKQFIAGHPDYTLTEPIDSLRRRDFSRLKNEVYLDFTGGSLYGKSQLQKHFKLLQTTVLGNPHSENPSSSRSTDLAHQARRAVLTFFNAKPNEYCVIFTPNASGAIKLVGEAYPFSPSRPLLQFVDNHNSVVGIREFAKIKGAPCQLVASLPDMYVNQNDLRAKLSSQPGLLAYPAQSNFSGIQHSLQWIRLAKQHGWDVLLDAAAFAPTNILDLCKCKPDFVCLSFYKMFGWPTGIGCLLARKEALARLTRPWFAGGTVLAASSQGDWHALYEDEAAFEDGTINFLNLPAVTIGLEYLNSIGMQLIHKRITLLTDWLLDQMRSLKHSNGQALFKIYGPHTTQNRGGTIAFNLVDPSGKIIDERIISKRALAAKISLRTGCFCNPGSGETAFNIPLTAIKQAGAERSTLDEYLKKLGLPSGGAIRISLGYISNFTDVWRLIDFAKTFLNQTQGGAGLKPRSGC